MDSLVAMLGIQSWKPFLTALILPPVPLLLGVLVGARLLLPRRGLGWLVIVLSVIGLWLSACSGWGRLMEDYLLRVPSAISPTQLNDVKEQVKGTRRVDGKDRTVTAIVVLGGGREAYAPEYGVSNLTPASLERLRYGVWLSRETGAPVAFSGGVGWGQTDGWPEAEVASRVASQDFGRPLRWVESQSRDTRENARLTLALLRPAGVNHILLVTHGWHMPRALQAFQEAAGAEVRIESAPMGLARRSEAAELDWLPSSQGYAKVRQATREWIGKGLGF